MSNQTTELRRDARGFTSVSAIPENFFGIGFIDLDPLTRAVDDLGQSLEVSRHGDLLPIMALYFHDRGASAIIGTGIDRQTAFNTTEPMCFRCDLRFCGNFSQIHLLSLLKEEGLKIACHDPTGTFVIHESALLGLFGDNSSPEDRNETR